MNGSHYDRGRTNDRERVSNEQVLKHAEFDAGRKQFALELCENARGRFIRVREFGANGRGNSVIVPEEGWRDFQNEFHDLREEGEKQPA